MKDEVRAGASESYDIEFSMRENVAVDQDSDIQDSGVWFTIPSTSQSWEAAAGLYGCHERLDIKESQWNEPFPKDGGIVLKVVLDRTTGTKLIVSEYKTDVQIIEYELSESNCQNENWNVWNNDLKVIYKDNLDESIEAFKKGNIFLSYFF